MSAPAVNEANVFGNDNGTACDLLIEEFSNWSNSKNAQISPTTSCWCRADLVAD
jgi:hypothetical protein